MIAHYIKCDVTNSDAVDAAADEIREKLGAPSILINNAGIGSDYPIFELPPQRVKKLVEVNLTSHWYVISLYYDNSMLIDRFTCRAFGPDMVKRNKGHIVEIASMSSFLGVGVFSDYSACKLALVSFTESESFSSTTSHYMPYKLRTLSLMPRSPRTTSRMVRCP